MFDAVLAKLRDPATLVCTAALAESHTAFVEAVHAAAKVQAVPAELISWEQPANGAASVPVVNGLEAALLGDPADRLLGRQDRLLEG